MSESENGSFNPRLVISHEAIGWVWRVSGYESRFNPRLVISHEAMAAR